MFLNAWRFLTLMLTALDMGMAFSHLLQMPPRMTYSARLWRESQSIYYLYGPPIGASIDLAAWIAAVVLALLLRRRDPRAFPPALAGALCFVGAHVVWWIWVAPVNAAMAGWTPDAMPGDWAGYRAQWEYAHAVRAILQIAGFAALLAAVLPGYRPITGGRSMG